MGRTYCWVILGLSLFMGCAQNASNDSTSTEEETTLLSTQKGEQSNNLFDLSSTVSFDESIEAMLLNHPDSLPENINQLRIFRFSEVFRG